MIAIGQTFVLLILIASIVVCWTRVDIVFPRDGEGLFPLSCNRRNSCSYALMVAAVYKNEHHVEFRTQIFIASSNQTLSSGSFVTVEAPFSKSIYTFTLIPPKSLTDLPVIVSIINMNDSIVVSRKEVDLLFLKDKDVPPQALEPYRSNACTHKRCKFDFVDIGTSNYDTSSHQAVIMRKDYPDKVFRGLSVEPMRSYLAQLPNSPDHVKINAAVKMSQNSGGVDFMYYIPESVIEDNPLLPKFLVACSSLSVPSNVLLVAVASNNLSWSTLQRFPVPLLSIGELFDMYVHTSVMNGVRLLKTDMEGLDTPVMYSLLEFYESRALWQLSSYKFHHYAVPEYSYNICDASSSVTADESWPCVIRFESFSFDSHSLYRDPLLMERFRSLGFVLLHDFDDMKEAEATAGMLHDSFAVNCACRADELELANELGHIVTQFNHGWCKV